MMSETFHARTMNLPDDCDPRDRGQFAYGYRNGHRSARHAAATIAAAADARIAELTEALREEAARTQAHLSQSIERADNATRELWETRELGVTLREDAERYRLWRTEYTTKPSDELDSALLLSLADAWTPSEVDAAIDAARSASQQAKESKA